MNNKTTIKKKDRKRKLRLHALWAKPYRISAHVTEEQDWQTDVPNVRLARVFGIVLILHVVAVGGILAFKMIEKTSTEPEASAVAASAPSQPELREPVILKPATAPEEGINIIVDDPSRIGMRHYRVRSGDNLLAVARRLEVSVSELEDLNELNKGNELYAGQVLLVPNRKISAMNEDDIHRLIGTPVPDQIVMAGMMGAETKVSVAEPISPAEPASVIEPPAPVVPVVAKAEPIEAPAPAVPALKPAFAPTVAAATTDTPPVVRPGVPVGLKPAPALAPAPGSAPRALPVASRTVNPPPAGAKSYTVQPGDTCYSIARRFGVTHENLMSVNGIRDARTLRLGQELKIP